MFLCIMNYSDADENFEPNWPDTQSALRRASKILARVLLASVVATLLLTAVAWVRGPREGAVPCQAKPTTRIR